MKSLFVEGIAIDKDVITGRKTVERLLKDTDMGGKGRFKTPMNMFQTSRTIINKLKTTEDKHPRNF